MRAAGAAQPARCGGGAWAQPRRRASGACGAASQAARAGGAAALASEARPEPSVARTVHVGNLPFHLPPADVAGALLGALAASGGASAARLVTRVAVSDFSAQGVAEYGCAVGHEAAQSGPPGGGSSVSSGAAPLRLPPPWPGAHAPAARKPRDADKHNRGFALLCCASAGGAAAAADALRASAATAASQQPALLGRQLRVGGDGGTCARVYLRELVAAREAAAAAAAAAKAARRHARVPHRRRQRDRARAARDAELAALLRAAYDGRPAQAAPPAQLNVSTDSDAAAADDASCVEALWAGAFSGWADAASAAAAGALPWADAPAAVDPCRGGGLDASPGGRGERKRAQVETFAAVLRGAALARPGAVLVDFGAGTGNLSLPLAWALPQCTVVAVDLKPESVARLAARATAAGLRNLSAVAGRIEDYVGPCDVALGLHVCGAGTDAVLAAAAARKVPFCVSPCCVGKLNAEGSTEETSSRRAPLIAVPRSAALRARVSGAQFARLAAAADFSGDAHVDGYDSGSAAGALPRAAKAAVESDRAAAAAEAGYTQVHLVKLLQPTACVRNDLLVGWCDGGGADAAAVDVAARALFVPPPAPPFARALRGA